MKYKIWQKLILIIVGVGLFLPASTFISPPQKAYAILGAGDVVTDPGHTITTIFSWAKEWVTKIADKSWEYAKKIAYVTFKRVVLDKLVDALVNWINHGGKGGIVENWDQFLDDAAQNAAGIFAQGIGAGFLCAPFNLQVQVALLPVEKFSKVTCTLNDIVGNINSFVNNFNNGGWITYQETWFPRNNFYGGTIIALDESRKAEAKAREASQNSAVAARGFLSFEKDDYFIAADGPYKDKNGTLAEPGYKGIRYKRDKRIVTPGTIAAEATTEVAVRIPVFRLIHSDDLSAYLNAIYDAAINQLTKEGIGWLKDHSRNLGLRPVNLKNPCAGQTGDGFRSCINAVNAERGEFQNTVNQTNSFNTLTLADRTTTANNLSQAITLQEELVDKLDALAACQGATSSAAQDIITEQETLDSLKDQFDTNQTFIDSMSAQNEKISGYGVDDNTSLSPDDWANLAKTSNVELIDDPLATFQALSSSQTELETVKTNVVSKLPAIEAQLQSCPTN